MSRSPMILPAAMLLASSLAACSGTDANGHLVVTESPEIDQSNSRFYPHFKNCWGDEDSGQELSIKWTSAGDAGLHVVVGGSNGHSWEYAVIDLRHGPQSDLVAHVKVSWFGDAGPRSGTWEKYDGWIRVSRSDWSTISAEHPLYMKFQLVDATAPYNGAIEGFVRVPQ